MEKKDYRQIIKEAFVDDYHLTIENKISKGSKVKVQPMLISLAISDENKVDWTNAVCENRKMVFKL